MSEKVHFDEFAEQVALETGYDIDTAKDYIYTLCEVIIEENERGKWVKLRNFGSFHPVFAKERNAVNPQTGEPMTIPAHYHVQFKPSASLAKLVNTKYDHLNPREIDKGGAGRWVLAAIALLALLGIGSYMAWGGGASETEPKTPVTQTPREPVEPSVPEPATAPEPAAAPEPVESAPVTRTGQVQEVPAGDKPSQPLPTLLSYRVAAADTLYDISDHHYGTPDYWPLLFWVNHDRIEDPDLIYPGMDIKIPGRIDLSLEEQQEQMRQGYGAAYSRYNELGRHEKAVWLIFRGIRHIDPKIETSVKNALDREELAEYLERF